MAGEVTNENEFVAVQEPCAIIAAAAKADG